jgi:hypothetical protein
MCHIGCSDALLMPRGITGCDNQSVGRSGNIRDHAVGGGHDFEQRGWHHGVCVGVPGELLGHLERLEVHPYKSARILLLASE